MARLISFPLGLHLTGVEIANGPAARNSGSTEAQNGFEQTFSGIGDLWAFSIDLAINRDMGARRERGMMTALANGANAMRFEFVDGDKLSPEEAGIVGEYGAQTWANGQPWANGGYWGATYPNVPVAAAAAVNTSVVRLGSPFWGRKLGMGDYIGFFPFHFGMYTVTEVIDEGEYRVWPRLRKAITTDDFATLHPVLAVKTMPGGARQKRGPVFTENQSLTLVEIIDPYVRQYFEG